MPRRELAIFGGQPAFAEARHVGRPNIGDPATVIRLLGQVLDRRWLSNGGPFVEEFEATVSQLVGVEHCVAVTNATRGIELVARALGLTGEVIVPAFTFIATAHALTWSGLKPVFVDVDAHTHNLDPQEVEILVGPETSAIMGVHVWGRPCPINELTDIARRHNLKLVFDAAHAFGASYGGVPIGGFGDAEVFSFHATKYVNSFEGGLVATHDEALAQKLRRFRNFGYGPDGEVESVGTNAKMHEASAAMGLASLAKMKDFITVNTRNYEHYAERLAGLPGLNLVPYERSHDPNYQHVVLEVDESRTGISRDGILASLEAENILARRYFHPGCHRMEPYRTIGSPVLLPQTDALAARVLSLPTGTAMSGEDVSLVCDIVEDILDMAPSISSSRGRAQGSDPNR